MNVPATITALTVSVLLNPRRARIGGAQVFMTRAAAALANVIRPAWSADSPNATCSSNASMKGVAPIPMRMKGAACDHRREAVKVHDLQEPKVEDSVLDPASVPDVDGQARRSAAHHLVATTQAEGTPGQGSLKPVDHPGHANAGQEEPGPNPGQGRHLLPHVR